MEKLRKQVPFIAGGAKHRLQCRGEGLPVCAIDCLGCFERRDCLTRVSGYSTSSGEAAELYDRSGQVISLIRTHRALQLPLNALGQESVDSCGPELSDIFHGFRHAAKGVFDRLDIQMVFSQRNYGLRAV